MTQVSGVYVCCAFCATYERMDVPKVEKRMLLPCMMLPTAPRHDGHVRCRQNTTNADKKKKKINAPSRFFLSVGCFLQRLPTVRVESLKARRISPFANYSWFSVEAAPPGDPRRPCHVFSTPPPAPPPSSSWASCYYYCVVPRVGLPHNRAQ